MAKVDNLTAVLHGINDIRLEQTPIPEIDDHEVLLEMACVGICGSDVHYLVEGRIGDFVVEKPMILGHEASGTVAKTGKCVKNLKVGDRVAIEPGYPCRLCDFCKRGYYNLCADITFCSTPPIHGNLRRFYKHPADFCFKLPDHLTFEEGALMEPLAVGVHACKRAGVSVGSKVLIQGAGPIGQVILLVAKSMGASMVAITDLQQTRLEMAKKLKADKVYKMDPSVDMEKHKENIIELMDGRPNVTIDASGADPLIKLAVKITNRGGNVVLVGMGSNTVAIPIEDVIINELNIKGVFRYANDYSDAISLVASKRFDIGVLVSHRFALEETVEAFNCSKSRESNAVKVIINCRKDDSKN